MSRTGAKRWHALRATPSTDPITGGRAGLLQQLDIDQQRSAEDRAEARGRLLEELHRTVALVEDQRREILALSAPILDVGAQTAALPLIGQAMVSGNLELARLTTMRTLRDGIELCRRLIAHGAPST